MRTFPLNAYFSSLVGLLVTLSSAVSLHADITRALIRGSVAVVFFKVEPDWQRCRVVVGKASFECFPLPSEWPSTVESTAWCRAHAHYNEGPSIELQRDDLPAWRFALVALPWDAPRNLVVRLNAKGDHGETINIPLQVSLSFPPEKSVTRPLVMGPTLQKAFRNIGVSRSEKDLVTNFWIVNRNWLGADMAKLADLRQYTASKFLWSGAFLGPDQTAKVDTDFGEIYRYRYRGKYVGQEVSLAYQIENGPKGIIPAANDGKVVFVDTLRMLGLCVVIDHGYGLQSIYAHLSVATVKKGDLVKKKDPIGLSGTTGFAEKDALYLGFQLNGIPIDAEPWWDERWLTEQFGYRVAAF